MTLKIPTHSQLFDAAAQGHLYTRVRKAVGPESREVIVDILVQNPRLHRDPRAGFLVRWIAPSGVQQEVEHMVTGTDLIANSESDVMTAMCEMLVGMVELRVRSLSGQAATS